MDISLQIKLKYGHSQAEIEEHLTTGAKLAGMSTIPTKWNEVLKLLKKLGYTAPKHRKVCVSEDHSILLTEKASQCHICSKPSHACIDYYVLGLEFEYWFCSDSRCQQLMKHWKEKAEWMGEVEQARRVELWHGKRWKELAYFWDCTKTTLLPERCDACRYIIPTSAIKDALKSSCSNSQLSLICPACRSLCIFEPRYMRGDPRNQAILIHEDGWAPHSTSSRHSIAAITITKGCMSKLDRCANKSAQVYSFVPVDQLPRECPHKLDGFLQPLLTELEDLYLYGLEVYFKSEIPGYSPADDLAILRAIPLLVTADLRAHSEMGLTSAGGRMGCRRCEVIGQYLPSSNHYYYGNIFYRYHNRSEQHTIMNNLQYGQQADQACSTTERKAKARETGITGVSIFYRLYVQSMWFQSHQRPSNRHYACSYPQLGAF